jgi:RHS repeat-associated protein
LRFDADGLRYIGPLGLTITFPPLIHDGAEASNAGLTLRCLGALHYQIEQADGPTMEFEFADALQPARLSALVRGEARVEFRYSRHGALEAIVESAGRFIHVDCDPAGRVLRLVLKGPDRLRDRELIVYAYDEAGNLVRGVDAYRHAFSFEYDAANRLVRRTDRRGYSFYFAYDGLGRCIHSRGEDGLYEVRLDYRPGERRTLVTQTDGGVWEYKCDENGVLTEIVDPYGGSQRFRYDGLGKVTEEVDPNGDVTHWVYDRSGHLIGKRSSLGHFSADGSRPLRPDQWVHRTPGRPSEWEYGDLLTPERLRVLPTGTVAQDGLTDKLRRLVEHVLQHAPAPSEPPKVADREIRDELGKLVREIAPDGRVRHWNYDAGGNTVRYYDFDGSLIQCEYSSWDLPSRRTDPIGRTLTRRFTASARVAELVDPAGVRSAYVYDLKGRLSEFWYEGARVEGYRYDAADNLIAKLDHAGQPVVSVEIGPKNLKTVRRLASGETHRFTYTERGYYAGVATDDISVKFDYDQYSSRTLDERDGRGVEHLFDGPRSLTQTTVLKRFTTLYQWSSDTALDIHDPGGRTHRITFLGGGVVARSMSSGLSEAARYDNAGRCLARASLPARLPAWEAPWVRQFTYSGEGDLLEALDSAAGAIRYEYDAAHRLRYAVAENGTRATFLYDVGDNLLQQPGLADVSIASGNRLHSANGDEFEYDDRGNIAVRRRGHSVTRYHYDSRNMLVFCQTPRGEWRATYDPLGRRVRKSLGEEGREFYWDTDRLAAELHHDGRLRVYVYADAFAMVPLLWLDYASPDADPASGRRYFLQCDHRGTPVRVENEAGHVVWRAQVAPYGSVVMSDNARVEMPLRFPGHYFDPETGLHYNRFRYYSPELGRYLQPDPLGTEAGNNLYVSTANPLKEVDVRGDCPTNGTDKNKKKTAEDGEPADGPILQEQAGFPPRTRKAVAIANDLADALNAHINTLPNDDPLRNSANAVGVMTHPDGTITVAVSGSPAAAARANEALTPHLDQMQQNGQISGYRFGPDDAYRQSADQRTTCAAPRLGDGARTPDAPPPGGQGPRVPDPSGTTPPPPNGMAEVWRRDDRPNPNPDPRGQNTMYPCDSCAAHASGIMNGPIGG